MFYLKRLIQMRYHRMSHIFFFGVGQDLIGKTCSFRIRLQLQIQLVQLTLLYSRSDLLVTHKAIMDPQLRISSFPKTLSSAITMDLVKRPLLFIASGGTGWVRLVEAGILAILDHGGMQNVTESEIGIIT